MINSIQALRAIAAIYVVIFHAARKIQVEDSFTHAGASGVDLFFIISGFVITYTTLKSNIGWKDFVLKRLVRIVPLYWFLTLVFASVLLFAPGIFQTYTFDLTKLVYSLLFIPQIEKPVVYTGWTLNYEMYFYGLFSLGILLKGVRAPIFVTFFLLASALIGMLNILPHSPIFKLLTSPLLIEFAFGIWLCYVFRSGFRLSIMQSLIFILAGFACFFLFQDATRIVSYGLPWLLIFIGVVFSSTQYFEGRTLLFLGDASYSIYLVHIFTLPALHFIFTYLDIATELNPTIFLVLYSSIGVLSGVVCFVLIERPLLTFFNAIVTKIGKRNKASASPP